MRKVNVIEFVSLDGAMQAPGGPEESANLRRTQHAPEEVTRRKHVSNVRLRQIGM